MKLPNYYSKVSLKRFKSGTLLLIGFVDHSTGVLSGDKELRLMQENGTFYILASNYLPSYRPLDTLINDTDILMVQKSVRKIVPRSDLPLYLNWNTGTKFLEVLKGEA